MDQQAGGAASLDSVPSGHGRNVPHRSCNHHRHRRCSGYASAWKGHQQFVSPPSFPPPGMSFPPPGMVPPFLAAGLSQPTVSELFC